MPQRVLFVENDSVNESKKYLGNGLSIEVTGVEKSIILLYRNNNYFKTVDISDRALKRLFVVELVELGAKKSYIADVLNISRQSIHNYLESKKYFGVEGVIHNYKPGVSKNLRKQRQENAENRVTGNKARELAQIRKRAREDKESGKREIRLFSDDENPQALKAGEEPFANEHGWQKSRYAGIGCYHITLITQWRWLDLVIGHFGNAYRIFMVFLLMGAQNTRSIEQLKNVRAREAGAALGLLSLPSKPKVWEWFYQAAHKNKAKHLLRNYFRSQIQTGLVGIWLWFTDGHLLPYTGNKAVRSGYNTQRSMPEPGQTNIVTCDSSGRVVDFEIYEGKGDFRNHIVSLKDKWEKIVPGMPVQVFDREGTGTGFFYSMVSRQIPFVTWEKHAKTEELKALEADKFTCEFEFNSKSYRVFEETKHLTYEELSGEDGKSKIEHNFCLRRIYLWNKTSNRRTCGLAWDGDKGLSTEECAQAILSRWGASENTFKHIQEKHPFHYHPGFKTSESAHQEIENPVIKEKEGIIQGIKKVLSKLHEKHAKASVGVNQDGKPRQNSKREKLRVAIEEQECELKKQKEAKNQEPKKVDVSTLENYKTFKQIDNEGKNLFDFATSSIWNARKEMVDWLRPFFTRENELVDLFYAITYCHGWIKNTKTAVIFRLEPLEQPKRRFAQEQLCRKLTTLCAKTPGGKRLVIEVGESPYEL